MTISNINIFGFGPLSDRSISLTGGENRADTGENSEISEDKAIGAFITAIFCGFREDIAAREPERKWEAAALLPSRAEYRPENGEFGGELAFSEGQYEYIASAVWGDSAETDRIVLIRVGEHSVNLAPGETVCGKAAGIDPLDMAALITMPKDGQSATRMLTALEKRYAAAGANRPGTRGGNAVPVQKLKREAAKLDNPDGTGLIQRLEAHQTDLAAELERIAALENDVQDLNGKIKTVEKLTGGSADQASPAPRPDNAELLRLCRTKDSYDRAENLRLTLLELDKQLEAEDKRVRRRHILPLILLWLLAIVSVAGIVLLAIYPENIVFLRPLLTAVGNYRFAALIGVSVVFLLSVIGIAACSGAGMQRVYELEDEFKFKKRELAELLGLDHEDEDFATDDTDNKESFGERADKAIAALKEIAEKAEHILNTGDRPAADKAVDNASPAAEAEKRLGVLTALREQRLGDLAAAGDCADIKERLRELNGALAAARTHRDAIKLAITALEHSGSAGNDRSAFISDFERLACAHLSALTGGNYTKLQLSPELTAAVEENGTMRGTGAFSSDTHSRIMLALKRAQLALQRDIGAPWFSLVGSTPEIVTDRNRFG